MTDNSSHPDPAFPQGSENAFLVCFSLYILLLSYIQHVHTECIFHCRNIPSPVSFISECYSYFKVSKCTNLSGTEGFPRIWDLQHWNFESPGQSGIRWSSKPDISEFFSTPPFLSYSASGIISQISLLKYHPFYLFSMTVCIMSYLGYVIESHLVFLTIISLILHPAWVICINRDLIIMTLLHSKPRSMEIEFCHRLEGFGSSTGHKNPVTLNGMTVTSL